jgi:DNA-binding beta-propeller fold protein YncE
MSATRRDFLGYSLALGLVHAPALRAQGATITTITGNGERGMAADGAAALAAPLNNPYGVIESPDGRAMLFVDNGSHRILAQDLASGLLTVIAGTGTAGYSGDGGPATAAQLAQPHEIRFDSRGNLLIAERDNHIIRKVDMQNGLISTLAGIPGSRGYAGDGGPATAAEFNQPHALALDANDNLYICDVLNHRVRFVDAATGLISTLAGNGEPGPNPAAGSLLQALEGPRTLEVTPDGRIFLALREGNRVYELNARSGTLQHIAGTGVVGYSGDGGPALEATFGATGPGGLTGPKGLCVSEDGRTLFVADCENHVIRAIDLATMIITTVAGTGEAGNGMDGDPLQCALNRPHGVYHRGNTLYLSDSSNHKMRILQPI